MKYFLQSKLFLFPFLFVSSIHISMKQPFFGRQFDLYFDMLFNGIHALTYNIYFTRLI